MTLTARLFGPLVKSGRLTVIQPDGARETFGNAHPDFPDVTIRLEKGVMGRMLANPALGAAEAYMDGALEIIEGDVWGLATLYTANAQAKAKRKSATGRAVKRARNRLLQWNGIVRSRRNVAHHYDLGNEFYRLFLDADMQYSCAYFPERGLSLEEAQRAKKAHIAAKLDLRPGQRVLDIGCGWGGMALYLARAADVSVHGITLSEEQYALASRRAEEAGVSDRVSFEIIDYRLLAEREPQGFDRIVSVGMFEHVGQPQFDTFFEKADKLLKSNGIMLLHTIGRFGEPGMTDAFTRKYIFPGGYIPALSEIAVASQKSGLIVSDVETLRLHYGWTIRHWYERTVANRDRIVAMYDERFYRMWLFYLSGAGAAFLWGGMGNFQLQYVKNRHALPPTRDYMIAREAEYLAIG